MVIVDVNSAIDCILRNRNKAKLKFIPPSKMNHDHDVKPFAIFLGIDDVSSTTVNSVNGSTKRSPNTTQHTILPRSFQYETFNVFNWDDYLAVSFQRMMYHLTIQ